MDGPTGAWAIAWTIACIAWGALWIWINYGLISRLLGGQGIGPRGEAVSARPRAWHIPPPPQNPNASVWRPWFMYPGPLFLELKFGLASVRGMWPGHVHELVAYRFYVEDRLPEAIEAAEQALEHGIRPACAGPRVRDLAIAEIEASATARLVTANPFTFELPGDTTIYDALADTAVACQAQLRELVGFEPRPTTVTLLPAGELAMGVDSRWGYVIPRRDYDRICVIRRRPEALAGAAASLVVEYAQLAPLKASAGNAPWWLAEGLGAWLARDMGFGDQHDDQARADHESAKLSVRVFNSAVVLSPIISVAISPAAALEIVDRLASVYGEAALGEFARGLATQPEVKAFRSAFGVSMRSFASQWRRN